MSAAGGLVEALRTILRAYQWQWMQAAMSFQQDIAILGGRQSGKDYWLEIFLCIHLLTKAGEIQVVSASRTHAQDVISNVRAHLDKLLAALGLPRNLPSADSKTEIRMPWGSRIKSHAASVRSIVGHRGSFILNEISAIPCAQEIWEAALPIVSESKKNGEDSRFIIIGNASYTGSFWQQLWDGTGTQKLKGFRKFRLPSSEAWRLRGYSPEEVAKSQNEIISQIGLGAFRQWFECEWRSAEGGFFSQILLDSRRYRDEDLNHTRNWSQVIGLDVGHGTNPTAAIRLLIEPGTKHPRYFVLPSVTWQETEYQTQVRRVKELCSERMTTAILMDRTGAEELFQLVNIGVGGGRVFGHHFSAGSKWEMFRDLLQALETRELWIPPDDLSLRMELDAIERRERPGGIPEIILPKQGDTHGDRAVALALALRAAGEAKVRDRATAYITDVSKLSTPTRR